jgi:beta-galactosamide-alpha-2,3-sialyltransferase
MDLFICSTPLQAKIALRIIESEKIKNYEVFYFTHVVNEKQKLYFQHLAKDSVSSNFYVCNARFPMYFAEVRRMFKQKSFDSIYLASIDNIYAHLVLTNSSFTSIKTFDDGGANISKSSIYYISRRSLLREFLYYILGCRFNLEKVKSVSLKHFSIYPSMDNIIDNVVPLALFDQSNMSRDESSLEGECHVLLGSYFSSVSRHNVSSLVSKLESYFRVYDNAFYISHPMESSCAFSDFSQLSNEMVAEDVIFELGKKYEVVNVYGIASSALFNLLGISWINTYTLVSSELTDGCNALSDTLVSSGGRPFYID